MTTIGLVRHGITSWNEEGRIQGSTDIPLNDTGREQAIAIGKRLKSEKWDFMISSDLIRARETAEIIERESGIVFKETSPLLREKDFGRAEGTINEERLEKFGIDWRKQDLGGETNEQVQTRFQTFLTEIVPQYANQNILIVSHGAFISNALRSLSHEREEYLKNCSLTKIKQSNDVWELDLYNCVEHFETK